MSEELYLRQHCPPWCVSMHGLLEGEEDWLHIGEPLSLAEGVTARLVMSVNPDGGCDGPYLLLGPTEHTLPDADRLVAALHRMVREGWRSSRS